MKCFVIIPFAETFDPVFEVIRAAAAEAVQDDSFECHWLKDQYAAGRITDDIIHGLTEASFCIADVSGHNPNVMWETGFAMALGKPTILIGQDIQSLPFDLKMHRVLAYDRAQPQELRKRLEKAIRDTLARYELKVPRSVQLDRSRGTDHFTVAVTGSMNANEANVRRRIETVLRPYLSDATHWLIGSFGKVDVAAVRFLLEHKQKVAAVGYHRLDCDPGLRKLIENGQLGFVDPSVESIPKGLTGPSKRDVFFGVKSNLVILFWDGESPGTRALANYFKTLGISTLLAFV